MWFVDVCQALLTVSPDGRIASYAASGSRRRAHWGDASCRATISARVWAEVGSSWWVVAGLALDARLGVRPCSVALSDVNWLISRAHSRSPDRGGMLTFQKDTADGEEGLAPGSARKF